MNQTISITSTSLHFREGNSDKEYHAAVEPEGEGYRPTGEAHQPITHAKNSGEDTRIRCQLLNPVDVEQANEL